MLSQYSYLIMRMSLGEDDEYNIECTKRTTSIASFLRRSFVEMIVMVFRLNTTGTVS